MRVISFCLRHQNRAPFFRWHRSLCRRKCNRKESMLWLAWDKRPIKSVYLSFCSARRVTYTMNSNSVRLMLYRRWVRWRLSADGVNRFRKMDELDHRRVYRISPVLVYLIERGIVGKHRCLCLLGYGLECHWLVDVNVGVFEESTWY